MIFIHGFHSSTFSISRNTVSGSGIGDALFGVQLPLFGSVRFERKRKLFICFGEIYGFNLYYLGKPAF